MYGSAVLRSVVFVTVFKYVCTEPVPCGPRGKQCIEGESTCQSNRCVCNDPPYTHGDGYFACYTKDQVAAETKDDPTLTNFKGQSVRFPFPCRYKLTHVKQQLKNSEGDVVGTCELQVHPFNAKFRGKIYVYGFDLALRLTYSDGRPVVGLTTRKYGISARGQNIVVMQGTNSSYLPNGPYGQDEINYRDEANGIVIRNSESLPNNQLIFEAEACGVRVTFVPYSRQLGRKQPQIPGISVRIDVTHDTEWLSLDEVLGLSPLTQPGQSLRDIKIPGLTKQESVFVRAFRNLVPQIQPFAADECLLTQQRIGFCSDSELVTLFDACYWMLEEPRFMRCIDQSFNANGVLICFNDCVGSACRLYDISLCSDVIGSIRYEGCDKLKGIPKLTAFVNGSLCPNY